MRVGGKKYKFEIKMAGIKFDPIYRKTIEPGINFMTRTIRKWQDVDKKTAYVIVLEKSISGRYVPLHTVEIKATGETKNMVSGIMAEIGRASCRERVL